MPPFIKVAIFSDVILVSNYHGCKEEVINLIAHYLVNIIYKTVNPSHLEELEIIRNVNKLMFQVIFIFSDWILTDQIIDFQKILPGVVSGGLGHEQKCIDSMHLLGIWTP